MSFRPLFVLVSYTLTTTVIPHGSIFPTERATEENVFNQISVNWSIGAIGRSLVADLLQVSDDDM